MGGLRGGAYLQKGDVLHLQRLEPSGISAGILCRVRASSRAETPRLNLNALLSLLEARESKQSSGGVALRLRFVRGAQWEDFSESARQDFLGGQFVVLPESNRMGVRLKPVSLPNEKTTEETLALAAARNAGAMISRAVFPGAAQVPPDGNPIVLLADAQTTGGYPVIASVIQPDIGKLAQARAGDRIAWEEISLGEARELERQWEQTMRRYRAALRIYALG
jgi:antagonist of KipI